MAGPTKSNLPQKTPLRWSLYKAAHEFEVAEGTLVKRLKDAHEEAGQDGCYATEQVVHAMFGSLHLERLRKLREEGDKIALENQIVRGEVLSRVALTKAFGILADSLLTIFNAADGLSKNDRKDLLETIYTFPLILEEVASSTSRLPINAKVNKKIEAEETAGESEGEKGGSKFPGWAGDDGDPFVPTLSGNGH